MFVLTLQVSYDIPDQCKIRTLFRELISKPGPSAATVFGDEDIDVLNRAQRPRPFDQGC
jgi:hypothetical protein